MKFARRLMTVSVLVALIVGVGFALKHSPAAGLISDDNANRPSADQTGHPRDGGGRGNHGLSISNIGDLAQSLAVQAAVLSAVVLIDQARRRRSRVDQRQRAA